MNWSRWIELLIEFSSICYFRLVSWSRVGLSTFKTIRLTVWIGFRWKVLITFHKSHIISYTETLALVIVSLKMKNEDVFSWTPVPETGWNWFKTSTAKNSYQCNRTHYHSPAFQKEDMRQLKPKRFTWFRRKQKLSPFKNTLSSMRGSPAW